MAEALRAVRRKAYAFLNGPPLLNAKFRMRQHLADAKVVLNDARQWPALLNPTYYKQYEKQVVMGVLGFSVASICSAKCIFCAYKDGIGPKGIMTFETFKKAADQYAEMGGDTISLSPTVGDPLVDPGLMKKIEYAVGLPSIKTVQFYTNGIGLHKQEMYKKLVHSGLNDIRISMAETDRDGYNKVYGVKAYDVLIRGIHELLRYNHEQGEPLAIGINFRSSWAPEAIVRSPDFNTYIKPYLSDRVIYDFLGDYDNWGGVISQKDLLGVMRMRREPRLKRMPCRRTFDLMVLYNGAVRICACRIRDTEFDELVVGNIHEQDLRSIFYGAAVARIRESFPGDTLPPVCKGCSLYEPATPRWLERRSAGERTFHELPYAEKSAGARPA